MTNILQSISQVAKESDISGEELPEPLPTKSVKPKAISTRLRSAAGPVEEGSQDVAAMRAEKPPTTSSEKAEEFLGYIQQLKKNLTDSKNRREEKIRNKTLHCLTNLDNYIESLIHDSEQSEKLDVLKLTDDIQEILDKKNEYDRAIILQRMDRKIAKVNQTEALLSYEVRRYLVGVLKEVDSPRQIGRIWS